jgi:hypothetical protein
MELVYSLITHLASWSRYALIAYLFLNLFVHFLLPFCLPFSTSIGHLTPTSLHNIHIKWNGIEVKVHKFGFSARGSGGKSWMKLYGQGIRLTIPRSTLLDLLSKPREPKDDDKEKDSERTEPSSCPASTPPPSLVRRLFLPFLIRRLLHIVSIHLELTIDVEGVALVEGTVRFGGHYKKPHLRVPLVGTPRQEDKLSIWASIEDLTLTEALKGLDRKEDKKLLPAVELRERVTFRLQGPVGYEEWKTLRPREGSIRASVEKEVDKNGLLARMKRSKEEKKDAKGLVVRIHQIKRLLASVEEIHSGVKEAKQDSTTKSRPSSPSPHPPKPSPLVYFDSFAVSLPTIIFSLHYTTPISVLASSSPSVNQALPQTIAFAVIVFGITGNLKLKASSEGEWTRDSHKAYLGRGRTCEVVGSIGWEELEGRMHVDGKEGTSEICSFLKRGRW